MDYYRSIINFFSGTRLNSWTWRGISWLAVVVLFSYLFITSDWDKILEAFNQMHFLYFFFVLLCYFFVQFVADCFGVAYTLKQFGLNVPYTKVFIARGITFLFAVVHYSAGQGALPFYLSRTHRLSLWTTSSVILFLTFIDLYWVIFLSFLGALGVVENSSSFLLVVADHVFRIDLILFMFLAFFLFFWRIVIPQANVFPQPVQKGLVWLGQKPLCLAFRQANLYTYLRLALVRMPVHLSMVFFSFLALKAFTSEVPSGVFVLVYPLTLLIGTLPITPAGLGTTQIAVVELLRGFATREALFAFGLMWGFGILVLKMLLGVLFLHSKFINKSGRD